MSATCRTSGCIRAAAHHQTHCRSCLHAMLDLNVPAPVTDSSTWQYEHMATCHECSKVSYDMMMTRSMAHQLNLIGVRCGWCHGGTVVIEELSGRVKRVA